jgi:hypothetical protein
MTELQAIIAVIMLTAIATLSFEITSASIRDLKRTDALRYGVATCLAIIGIVVVIVYRMEVTP